MGVDKFSCDDMRRRSNQWWLEYACEANRTKIIVSSEHISQEGYTGDKNERWTRWCYWRAYQELHEDRRYSVLLKTLCMTISMYMQTTWHFDG